MAVTAVAFRSLAEAAAVEDSEIEWRNSISRGYYAAFHQAKNAADGAGVPDPSEHLQVGSHQRVFKRYEALSSQPHGKMISYILQDMQRRRNQADYDLASNVSSDDAIIQLKTLDKIEQKLIECFSGGNC